MFMAIKAVVVPKQMALELHGFVNQAYAEQAYAQI
jgi:hypothetical protein